MKIILLSDISQISAVAIFIDEHQPDFVFVLMLAFSHLLGSDILGELFS